MTARIAKGLVVAAVMSLLAACASGASSGGIGGGRLADAGPMPVVTDPAPIVSGTMRPYQIRGRWYRPEEQPNYDETGLASWYGAQFNGRPTATGERFDMHALTAAHKTLPLPGLVEVTNLANGRRIVVRVNDRGPFAEGRIIDLSRGAAEALDLLQRGVGEVRVRYLGRAPREGGGTTMQYAAAEPVAAGPTALRGPVPYLSVAGGQGAVMAAVPAAPVSEPVRYEAPTPMVRAPTVPSPVAGQWVQAGAWADARAARRAAETLGGSARVEQDAGGAWRVLVGPWPDASAAERSRRAVISRGYPDALLISTQ
ncbi:septal ring lytic transglycosylase RlpA family protein [Brevundimonas sp.]|uniref:septal ring lytic transglycosylase RlpA family protein n=1 Tax=Brevundimonas sp. TaxID=1871086 RepID=UPI0025C4DC0C|nr:septal ring lytic transglycosylase RlpA family protein [Brevundimonas sp.]